MSAAESTSAEATSSAETAAVPEATSTEAVSSTEATSAEATAFTEAAASLEATAAPRSDGWRRCDARSTGDMRYSCDRHRMRRGSRRRRARSKWRLMVTTLSANRAAAVAVVAIMVTVAARIIVDGRGVPPSPVRVVVDHVRVVRIVTVGVAVVLLLRQVVPRAPKLLRAILPGCAPLSDYRERDHYNDRDA
jgi:hypothetical protein